MQKIEGMKRQVKRSKQKAKADQRKVCTRENADGVSQYSSHWCGDCSSSGSKSLLGFEWSKKCVVVAPGCSRALLTSHLRRTWTETSPWSLLKWQ